MKGSKYQYQIILVLNPKTESKGKILTKVESWLKQNEAEISNKENFGVKDLAYEIKDCDRGDFEILEVEMKKPLKMKDLNLLLDREVNIIRYLILKV